MAIWLKWFENNPFKTGFLQRRLGGDEFSALQAKYGLSWREVKIGDFVIMVHPEDPEMLQLGQVTNEPDLSNGGKEFYKSVSHISFDRNNF